MTYDERLSSAYDAAQRDEPLAAFTMWMERFVHHASRQRPLSVLDLGSGQASSPPPWPTLSVVPSSESSRPGTCEPSRNGIAPIRE